MKLDKAEQDILASLERGEWKSVKNLHEEIKRHEHMLWLLQRRMRA